MGIFKTGGGERGFSRRRCGREEYPASSSYVFFVRTRDTFLWLQPERGTMQLSRPSFCRFEAGLKKRLAKAEKGR
jgi:hypothetical protein